MAEGAQRGAETLPSDPLQVLSEFVQNANDARASQLRFLWRPDALLIAHDGVSVRMGDVLLLGMPWLGGKTADAQSTGRFGIGLSTLRALATTWEVHCHPFHVQFADLALEPVAPPELPEEISGPQWTVFRISLESDALPASDLFEWFERASDLCRCPAASADTRFPARDPTSRRPIRTAAGNRLPARGLLRR